MVSAYFALVRCMLGVVKASSGLSSADCRVAVVHRCRLLLFRVVQSSGLSSSLQAGSASTLSGPVRRVESGRSA
jgi:hypothetical protein